MEQVRIIEVVTGRPKKGVAIEDAKKAITGLNDFVKEQPGFVARKTALTESGEFLDIIYWTDMTSAKTASKKAMTSDVLIPISNTIDEETMTLQHFEVFNNLEQ